MRILLLLLLANPAFAGGGFFRPTPAQQPALIWWAVSPMNTLSNSDVTAWTVLAGGSGSQVTNGQRPTISANSIGNYPAISFSAASSQCLNTTQASTNLFDMANTNITVAIVFRCSTNTSNIILGSSDAVTTSRIQLLPSYLNVTYGDLGGANGTNQSRVQLAGLTWTNTYHVGIWTRSNSALKAIWKDGTNQVTFVNGTTFGTTSSTMTIGSSIAGAAQFFNGDIVEFAVWAGNFNSNQLVRLSRMLGDKYGISVQ